MSELPPRARRVIELATALSLAVVLWLAWTLPQLEADLLPLAVAVLIAATASEFLAVPLRRGGVVSISTIVHVAAILLLPIHAAVVLVAIAVLTQQALTRTPRHKATFNTASSLLTTAVTGVSTHVLGNPLALLEQQPLLSLASVLLVAFTYYLATSGQFALLVSALRHRTFWYVMRADARDSAALEVGTAVIGGLLAFVWQREPWWTLTMAFPAGLAHQALAYLHRVITETDAAVETIADIVEERDHYTHEHSRHVAEYSEMLAVAMRLDPDEAELIASAGRVHDLGKIGVGDRALRKAEALDTLEKAEMQRHPVIGARILGHFEGYRDGVRYVLHHHEHWDGSGYPSGLKGEEIPLGARVLAVADAFDAMTTNRPYRAALSVDEAFQRIRAAMGTQLDPVVAGHFLALEPQLRARIAARGRRGGDARDERPDAHAGPVLFTELRRQRSAPSSASDDAQRELA
jgi:HD-GYP domain-containing protein (c-di-GMP phosphodiesterase class II)